MLFFWLSASSAGHLSELAEFARWQRSKEPSSFSASLMHSRFRSHLSGLLCVRCQCWHGCTKYKAVLIVSLFNTSVCLLKALPPGDEALMNVGGVVGACLGRIWMVVSVLCVSATPLFVAVQGQTVRLIILQLLDAIPDMASEVRHLPKGVGSGSVALQALFPGLLNYLRSIPLLIL